MLSNTNSMVGTEINCGHDELQIVIITEAVKKEQFKNSSLWRLGLSCTYCFQKSFISGCKIFTHHIGLSTNTTYHMQPACMLGNLPAVFGNQLIFAEGDIHHIIH